MSAKTSKKTKGPEKEEAATTGPERSGFSCDCLPSGEAPACCGPQMREMFSAWCGQAETADEK